jgi:hypothetical protein
MPDTSRLVMYRFQLIEQSDVRRMRPDEAGDRRTIVSFSRGVDLS